MLEAAILVIFPFCMVFAAVSDALSMTIANRVSVLLVVSFAVVAPLTGMAWDAYAWHFAAFGVVLAVTFTLFAIGAMGGGDAKLMAATALWMGFGMPLMEYGVASASFGGTLTLALLALRASPAATLVGTSRFGAHLVDAKAGVPYGIALGAAGIVVAPDMPLMAWAIAQMTG
jgi:prepilin peptidase CpaA